MWQTAPHNAVSHWFSMQRKAGTLPIVSAKVPALIASGVMQTGVYRGGWRSIVRVMNV